MVERQPNRPSIPESQHTPHEGGNGAPGTPIILNERAKPPPESQEGNLPVSPPRIPEQTIIFVQHAYASGADESLKERQRIFIAHAVTKPHLTLKELAPFADVGTAESARHIWDTGLQALWQASPPELQQQYPLDLLRRHRSKGVPFSTEHRTHWSEARQRSGAWERAGTAKKGKRLSRVTRARMSEAKRKYWERRKQQQDAGLTQNDQKKEHESTQVFSYRKKD
jgi:hypothetical protein